MYLAEIATLASGAVYVSVLFNKVCGVVWLFLILVLVFCSTLSLRFLLRFFAGQHSI